MTERPSNNTDTWIEEQQELIRTNTPDSYVFVSTITRSYIDAFGRSGMELLHMYEMHPETYHVVIINGNTLQELNIVYRKMNILDKTAQTIRSRWPTRS